MIYHYIAVGLTKSTGGLLQAGCRVRGYPSTQPQSLATINPVPPVPSSGYFRPK